MKSPFIGEIQYAIDTYTTRIYPYTLPVGITYVHVRMYTCTYVNVLGLQRLSGYTVPVRFLSVTESDIWNRVPVKFDVFQRRLVAYVIIVM